MKRTSTLASGAAAGFLALLLLFSGAVRAGDEVVFVSTDTPPFWSPTMTDDGWAGSVLKLLSAEAGVRYRIEYLPVKRFRTSDAPFIVGDPDILEYSGHYAVFPILVFRTAFFFHTPHHESSRFRSLEQMRGHTLGVLRGTLEDREFFSRYGISIEESDSVESLLKKLERGRIDFAIMLNATGLHAVRELFPQRAQEFASVYIPGTERPIAILVDLWHPEGKEIARRYRHVLEQVLHSGQYHRLLEQYYGKGTVPANFHDELKRFVEFYSDTWEE